MLIIDSNRVDQNSKSKQIAKLEAIAIELAIQGLNYEYVLSECNALCRNHLDECITGPKAPADVRRSIQLFTSHLNK